MGEGQRGIGTERVKYTKHVKRNDGRKKLQSRQGAFVPRRYEVNGNAEQRVNKIIRGLGV